MPDYRSLIEQVQNRGGPLRLGQYTPWGLRPITTVSFTDGTDEIELNQTDDPYEGPSAQDILCGVLRRDLVRKGHGVYTYERSGTPRFEVSVNGHVWKGNDMLMAFLSAWLEAVPEEI